MRPKICIQVHQYICARNAADSDVGDSNIKITKSTHGNKSELFHGGLVINFINGRTPSKKKEFYFIKGRSP